MSMNMPLVNVTRRPSQCAKYRLGGVGPIVVRYWRDQHDNTHRISGPAIERSNGSKEWWLGGYFCLSDFGGYLPGIRRNAISGFPGYGSRKGYP